MSATAPQRETDSRNSGERLVQARRTARLSQKALADRIGVSLWRLESLERGRGDPTPYLEAIAAATGCSRAWLVGTSSQAGEETRVAVLRRPGGRALTVGVVSVLVLARFFGETLPLLPQPVVSFIDVPLFGLLVGIALLRRRAAPGDEGSPVNFLLPAVGFLLLATLSAGLNLARVALPPVLVALYLSLGPIAVYYAVYRLWPVGNGLSFSRAIVVLGAIQLFVVATIDLPRFVATRNPDVISGTFGLNAYQLVFFLLVFAGLLAGIATFERHRLAARLAPVMFVGIAATIFLAQFRALLVTTLFTVLLIGFLLRTAPGLRVRGTLPIIALSAAFIGSLFYVAEKFPVSKIETTFESAQADPWYFVSQRLNALSAVGDLYTDDPRYIVTGSGPATFSSRAWMTFAVTNDTRTRVAGPVAEALMGGPYRTDVSEKHIVPRLDSEFILGSRALTKPQSSYTSLLAEVGIFGYVALIGAYALAMVAAARMAIRAMRNRVPRDPRPALLLAATVAFAVLLQMAALDNWLEVTRITFPSWALLAVAIKEHRARPQETAR